MSDRTDELRRRANTGDGDAQYQLAQALWTGDGVAADREQAIIWYRRAAGTDNPAYQLSFGLVLCWYGDMDNFRKGFRWILRAAQNGHVGAQYFVASEYARGEHIPKNSFEAAHWYRSAATAGHAEAKYNLAIMYSQGEGVHADMDKCRELLLAAGAEGELLALRALADGYKTGLFGLPKDIERAKYWGEKYEAAR